MGFNFFSLFFFSFFCAWGICQTDDFCVKGGSQVFSAGTERFAGPTDPSAAAGSASGPGARPCGQRRVQQHASPLPAGVLPPTTRGLASPGAAPRAERRCGVLWERAGLGCWCGSGGLGARLREFPCWRDPCAASASPGPAGPAEMRRCWSRVEVSTPTLRRAARVGAGDAGVAEPPGLLGWINVRCWQGEHCACFYRAYGRTPKGIAVPIRVCCWI